MFRSLSSHIMLLAFRPFWLSTNCSVTLRCAHCLWTFGMISLPFCQSRQHVYLVWFATEKFIFSRKTISLRSRSIFSRKILIHPAELSCNLIQDHLIWFEVYTIQVFHLSFKFATSLLFMTSIVYIRRVPCIPESVAFLLPSSSAPPDEKNQNKY